MERVRLRAGVAVARRDEHTLQVGLDAPHRVLATDTPSHRRLLDALVSGCEAPAPDPTTDRLYRDLDEAELLVRDTPPQSGPAVRVELQGDTDLIGRVEPLLAANGLQHAITEQPDVLLSLHAATPQRSWFDPLVRLGLPHLPVVATPFGIDVGPFVLPGRSACVRCVDAARGTDDPRRPLIVEQAARARRVDHPATVVALALHCAVLDLTTACSGRAPATLSRVRSVHVDGRVETRSYRIHAQCGCGWDRYQ